MQGWTLDFMYRKKIYFEGKKTKKDKLFYLNRKEKPIIAI